MLVLKWICSRIEKCLLTKETIMSNKLTIEKQPTKLQFIFYTLNFRKQFCLDSEHNKPYSSPSPHPPLSPKA